jgi:hypothetical protein
MDSNKDRRLAAFGPALERSLGDLRIGEPDFKAVYAAAKAADERRRSLRAHMHRAIPLAVAASLAIALGLGWNLSFSGRTRVSRNEETVKAMARLAIDRYSIVPASEADDYAASLFFPSQESRGDTDRGFGPELAEYLDTQSEGGWNL